jgi:hypothetical protein
MTPFQDLYGYEPPKLKEFSMIGTKDQAIKNQLEENNKIIKILKENLATSDNQMKQLTYQHRSRTKFEGGWCL